MAKKDDSGLKWSHELVRQIGAAMQKARGKRTAKWLSERTAELGYRVSPTVIAKLDSGHRGNVLSVAELLVIADALEVPPAALLFPGLPDGEVEYLPGQFISSMDGLFRFTGEHDESEAELSRLAMLARDLREKQMRRYDTLKLAEQLAADKPDFNVAPYMDEIFKMDKEINDLANRILEFQERGYGLISTGVREAYQPPRLLAQVREAYQPLRLLSSTTRGWPCLGSGCGLGSMAGSQGGPVGEGSLPVPMCVMVMGSAAGWSGPVTRVPRTRAARCSGTWLRGAPHCRISW